MKKKRGLKKFLPQTLFFRSLLILIIPILLLQIITTYVFFDRHWSKTTSRLAYAVAGEIKILSNYIEESKSQEQREKIITSVANNLDLLVIYEKEGVLKVTEISHLNTLSWESTIQATLSAELEETLNKPYTVNVDFQEKWVEVRVQLKNGVLNVSLPQRRLFSSTTYIFLLWVFAASMILLIIAILFMRNQIRPIRRLAVAAERLGKGREVRNFKIEGANEVRQAGQAFLDMKTRIQRQISQRTDMLAGVSHDLRTPLTRLKLQISMLGDSPDIYEMKKDVADMEKMIDGYLNFVRGQGKEKSKYIKLADLLKEITTSVKRQGCDVSLQLNDLNPLISLRIMAFKRALMNITGNAAKFADFIWISLSRHDDGHIKIIIEDDGPGIEPEKYEEVFRPFYRIEESRNQNTGGIGLGMPIAMDIIHSHGGEIWLDRSEKGGLAVHILLPD